MNYVIGQLEKIKFLLFVIISFYGVLCFASSIDLTCDSCNSYPCKCTITPGGGGGGGGGETAVATDYSYIIYAVTAVLLILIIAALIIHRKKSITRSRINLGGR